jgi:hypothetical protein
MEKIALKKKIKIEETHEMPKEFKNYALTIIYLGSSFVL